MVESDPRKLLVGAGALTWAVAGVPTIAAWAGGRGLSDGRLATWLGAYATFVIAFAVATAVRGGQAVVRPGARVAALAVQGASALVLARLGTSGFEGALLCVVAGQAPLLMGAGSALAWVATQSLLMLVVLLATWDSARAACLSTISYAAFQLFAFGATRLAARESAARQEVTRVHAELLATQELFADSTRTAERLRIARELHDALGHHLTALSLQLELARNVAEGRAKEPVDHAHALTKELLGELRTVVGAMREDQPLDLARALRTLVAGIPRPRVHLDVPGTLPVEPAVAHTIFRCVQEALTNAVRHADAQNVFLAIEGREGMIAVSVKDDGRGVVVVRAGNGLMGLRERVEGMGGRVDVIARPGEGVTLRALVPSRGGTA